MTRNLVLMALCAVAFVSAAAAECKPELRTTTLSPNKEFVISLEKCAELTDAALEGTTVLLDGSAAGEFVSVPAPRTAVYRLSSVSSDEKISASVKATWARLSAGNDPQPRKLTLALRDANKNLFVVGEKDVLTSVAIRDVEVVSDTSAGLGEMIDVRFYLPEQLTASLKLVTFQDLVLFFNGRPVGAFDSNQEVDTVRFKLGVKGWSPEASKSLEASWKLLLHDLKDDDRVTVAAGTLAQGPVLRTADKVKFDRFDSTQIWVGVVLGALVLAFFVHVVRREDGAVLRDEGNLPPNAPAGAKRAFSLARCQMAWWFLLVIVVVILHLALVGELATLPANILLLIGVSAGTGYLARAVDGNSPAQLSRGPLTDLLTNGGQPGLHRLQMIVWTLVLGGYFLYKFSTTLWAPDLGLSWIELMGLTSGVYVGFKIQEK